MQFLKKASYKDIIGNSNESQFHYYEDITEKYKEFELFLTEEDLNELLDDNNKSLKQLKEVLLRNGAVIKAIHCPESTKRTCNEEESEISSNYLSLCEVFKYEESKEIFKKVLKLANDICEEQSENLNIEVESEEEENDNDDEIDKKGNKRKKIIVILHEGCEKGCDGRNAEEEIDCDIKAENIAE